MPILLPPHDVTLTAADLSEDTAQDMIAVDKVGHTQALKYEYLIEDTLPSGRVSLLVGPSGSGKTTWFLQLAESWLKGEQILDKAVNRPLVHVRQECKAANCSDTSHYSRGTILHLAADRGAKDTEETMDRVLGDDSPLLSDKSFGFEWQSILNPDSTV